MGRLRVLAALAATATLGVAVAAAPVFAQDPVGAHSMLQLDDPPPFMEAMFSEAAAMRASAIRLDVAPALIFGEGAAQPPDFQGLDEVMSLAQAYHLRVVADLMTIPAGMADCAVPTSDPSRCATSDLSAYGSVVRQIVSHADPIIRDWEVWNEPDAPAFFDGTPQQYALMLRAAHDAIKAVDPADNVLLGGISGPAAMGWLSQVLATAGADAAHAFDVANVHERGDLWSLAPDLAGWHRFFAANGFTGPLWVTEHGYPSDPAYQYDPGYTGGQAAQASYLAASIPTLVDAGAAEVFVTERDNMGAQFASEGVLSGEVSDPPVAAPEIVPKPAFSVVQAVASCFQTLGRDCPSTPPTASPSALTLAAVPPGSASSRVVTIGDPGAKPVVLGLAAVTGAGAAGLSVAQDGCAGMVLEPRETCPITVQFHPTATGDAGGTLQVASDDGALPVPVRATAPSVSALRSRQLPHPRFTPAGGGDGIGYPQRATVTLTNPLSAAVAIARATLAGPDARRFRLRSDRCAPTMLKPHAMCRMSIVFIPTRSGRARAQLWVQGVGAPLVAALTPIAHPLPAVIRIAAAPSGCTVSAGAPVASVTDQPAAVGWWLTRAPGTLRSGCGRVATPGDGARRHAARAGTAWSARRVQRLAGARGYAARWRLGALAPGRYVLTATAVNRHGAGAPHSVALSVRP